MTCREAPCDMYQLAGFVVPGAGAFELAAHQELLKFRDQVKGKAKLGVQAYAEALLVIPKTLGESTMIIIFISGQEEVFDTREIF